MLVILRKWLSSRCLLVFASDADCAYPRYSIYMLVVLRKWLSSRFFLVCASGPDLNAACPLQTEKYVADGWKLKREKLLGNA
jgi:hypothetical protein